MATSTNAPEDLKKQPNQQHNTGRSRRHSHAAMTSQRMPDGRWQWTGSGGRGQPANVPRNPSQAGTQRGSLILFSCLLQCNRPRRQNRFEELFAQVAELEAREAASNHSESFKRLAMPTAAQRGSAHDCGGTGAAMFIAVLLQKKACRLTGRCAEAARPASWPGGAPGRRFSDAWSSSRSCASQPVRIRTWRPCQRCPSSALAWLRHCGRLQSGNSQFRV